MAYNELIKNFERIRDYMREFYIYGFKSRSEYEKKSGRSYDNERRRIESYLGNYMFFRQTESGKNVFLTIDSRSTSHNPLYQAWKAKSFTNGDITLHFILLDILKSPDIWLSLNEISDKMDREYLSCFDRPMLFDISTVRKKLKEYGKLGIIEEKKQGKQMYYRRSPAVDPEAFRDAISFFSEAAPVGVIGSYLLDKLEPVPEIFTFKHHYITQTMDSEILCSLFEAMAGKRTVLIREACHGNAKEKLEEAVPLRIYVSVQGGRYYLLGYYIRQQQIKACRLDHIIDVKMKEAAPEFEQLRKRLDQMQEHMWGVCCDERKKKLEHVEFTVRFEKGEEYIYRRLKREKRCGRVELIDDNTCRFIADVYDTQEMIPWIRTFICRITQLDFSNRTVENQFKKDLEDMYRLYELEGGDS